jgi:alkylhydroperoxidase family enzyme
VFRSLAEYWDEGQLVEITLVVGLFAHFNRFNDALQVEVTR